MADKIATVVGANGGFGRLFSEMLRSNGWLVQGVDLDARAEAPGSCAKYSKVAEDSSNSTVDGFLTQSSLVALCVPSRAAFWWIDHAAPLLSADSLCLDVLSVKTEVTARAAAAGFAGEYVSLHPMFAPQWGFEDFAVAAISVQDGERTARFLEMLASAGSRVVRIGTEQHDRAAAVLQGGAHAAVLAFGEAVVESGVSREILEAMGTAVSEPIFELVRRISGGDPATYHSIQAENPYAEETRANLKQALTDLDRLAGQADSAELGQMLRRIR
jgi:4-amino-4-deoxyprephenate dehydrogenase